jgi:hypothetical protein
METPPFRLFDVAAGASLTMENLMLHGGYAQGPGGAIYNEGSLALDDVTVENSSARGLNGSTCRCRPGGNGGPGRPGLGGGIYSSGSLLLQNSTLLTNQARGGWGGAGSPPGRSGHGGQGLGGGLFVAAGSAELYNSLVTGNSAVGGFGSQPGVGDGGGIYISGAEVGLDEWTIAHVTENTASTSDPNISGPYEIIPDLPPLPGDFNHDGAVNAADYVVWRNSDGTQSGFDSWRANFGRSAGSDIGAASFTNAAATIPEPATVALALMAISTFVIVRRNRRLVLGQNWASPRPDQAYILGLALLTTGIASCTEPAAADLFGPSPYLAAADSPFATVVFDYFHLENFEDGLLNVPGVTRSTGNIIGPGLAADSVDADDGSIDGSGNGGRSLFVVSAPITFTFDAVALGRLPTHAGIVRTDGGPTAGLEAFGPGMVSLGTIGPVPFGDGNPNGGTAEDRFFGWSDPNGILAIRIPQDVFEVDHLQYGFAVVVPEPGSCLLVGISLAVIVAVTRNSKQSTRATRRRRFPLARFLTS